MSIGETLAQARETAGLTVAEASHRTRIREAIIRGIEHDDYGECGGDFYARGHIRSLARAAGIDPEPLIEEYDRVWREPDVLTEVLELVTASRAAPPAAPPAEPGRAQPRWPAFAARGPGEPPWLPRGPWLAVLGAVIVVALGVAGFTLLTGSGQPRPVAAGTHRRPATRPPSLQGSATPARQSASAAPSPPASAPAPQAQPLTPAGVSAFGVGGPGAGDNSDLAHLAIDGSHSTGWHTDWYTSATFGNLYPGTGLLLDMGHPVTVTSVRLTLGSAPGADLQLRIGNQPSLGSLSQAAQASSTGGTVQLRLTLPARGRYVLIWFTRLPTDSAGTFQVSVRDVAVTGQG